MNATQKSSFSQALLDLQERVSHTLKQSPAGELERNLKALLAQGFQKVDLVTREELDIQQALLTKALLRVGELEQRVVQLEQQLHVKK